MMVYWASASSYATGSYDQQSSEGDQRMGEAHGVCDDALLDIDLEHLVLTSCHQNLACALGCEVYAA